VLLNWGNMAALGGANVPEPSTWAIMLLGCVICARLYRRRRDR
jgi:hypothetical protein